MPSTMIITCPSCATRYQVPADAFSSQEGRKVRCRSCNFEWFAVPDNEPESDATAEGGDSGLEEELAPGTEDLIETAAASAREETDDFASHLAEAERLARNVASLSDEQAERPSIRVRPKAVSAPPRRRRDWKGPAAIAATLALIGGGGFEYRETIVRALPATSAIYDAVGIGVNIRGMDFHNVRVVREFENGLPVLAIYGEVVNVSGRAIERPRVRLGLRDDRRKEIYHWTVTVEGDRLLPEARAKFATKLAAPPPEARQVEVRFHDSGMRIGRL